MWKGLFVAIFTVLATQAIAATDTLKLAGISKVHVTDYMGEFADCSRELGVDSMLTAFHRGAFTQPSMSRVINRGVTACQHWFLLTIKNTDAFRQDYLWSFYNDGIIFTLFELDPLGQRVVRTETASHKTGLKDRSISLRTIAFRLPLDAGETKTYLLKTELFGRQNLYFPTSLSTENDALASEVQFSFLLGRYYGFFLFATLFNLFLYVILRKRFYGVMFGYIAMLLAFNLVEYLHDVYFLPSWIYVYWSWIPKLVFMSLILFFNVKVFQHFTMHGSFFPRWNRPLTRMSQLLLFTTLAFLVLHILASNNPKYLHNIQVTFVGIMLIQTVLLMANIVLSARKRTTYIYHYLIGNSLFFASLILYVINALRLGDIPMLVPPGNTIFAFSFEVVYLMIAFTVKYKRDFDQFTHHIALGEENRKKLTAELIMVQENERQRIGQDIHDGIGGTLNGLRMLLSNQPLREQEKINDILGNINAEFRGLIHQISPRHMESKGLFGSIQHDIGYHEHHLTIECDFLGDEGRLPSDMKINIFRIYQELFTNAIKHAKNATYISVSIAIDEDQVRICLEDNGRGLTQLSGTDGMGLRNIRSRVDYYGGDFHLDPAPDGLTAIVYIPIQNHVT